jgi:hypothetical protein
MSMEVNRKVFDIGFKKICTVLLVIAMFLISGCPSFRNPQLNLCI